MRECASKCQKSGHRLVIRKEWRVLDIYFNIHFYKSSKFKDIYSLEIKNAKQHSLSLNSTLFIWEYKTISHTIPGLLILNCNKNHHWKIELGLKFIPLKGSPSHYVLYFNVATLATLAHQRVWPRFRLVVYSSFIILSARPSSSFSPHFPASRNAINAQFLHGKLRSTQPTLFSFSFFSYLISALLISLISY